MQSTTQEMSMQDTTMKAAFAGLDAVEESPVRLAIAEAIVQNNIPPLVIDFTRNQTVYETRNLPEVLLKWRIVVGQEVQIIVPRFRRFDAWEAKAVEAERSTSWLGRGHQPDVVSDVLVQSGRLENSEEMIPGVMVPALGEMEYPGMAFTFVGQKGGHAVVRLNRRDVSGSTGPTYFRLQMTVAER